MKRYIRESDLRAITEGSFERKRHRAMEAIDAYDKRMPHPLKRPTALVATFERHAIVADADGALHRFHFVENPKDGFVACGRSPYDGFETISESEMVEAAAKGLSEGKDITATIAKLLRP